MGVFITNLLQMDACGKGALNRIIICYLTNTEMQGREHKIKFLSTFWPKHDILWKCWFWCGANYAKINQKSQDEWYCLVSHDKHFLGFAVIISQSETGVYHVLPH